MNWHREPCYAARSLAPIKLRALVFIVISALASLRSATALAQDAQTIVRALQFKTAPQPAPAAKPLVRSFIQPSVPPSRGISIEGPAPSADPTPTIDLTVNFEYDQSALTMSDAQITVDSLGSALKDPSLATGRFMIIGHTDARGGEAYNLQLSQRRANAVRARLVDFHNVDASRLVAEGHGQREPKDPAHPDDPSNRRVQIKRIDSGPADAPVQPARPNVALNEPPIARFTPAPDRPVARKEPSSLTAFPPLPQRPRPSIYELPEQPEPILTPASQNLSPLQKVAAFSGGSASAVPVLAAMIVQRVGASVAPTEAEIAKLASAAVGNTAGLTAMLKTASSASLREDRMQALVIAEVARKLGGPQRVDLPSASKEALGTPLQELFLDAASDVYAQTRVNMEAQKLTRNASAFVEAVNEQVARGRALPGFETVASDRGRAVISAIEQDLHEMFEAEASKPLDEIFGRRNTLIQCLTLHLPAIAEANANRQPSQRAATGQGQITESAQLGPPSVAAVTITIIRTSCLPMLTVPGASMPVQDAAADVARPTPAAISSPAKP